MPFFSFSSLLYRRRKSWREDTGVTRTKRFVHLLSTPFTRAQIITRSNYRIYHDRQRHKFNQRRAFNTSMMHQSVRIYGCASTLRTGTQVLRDSGIYPSIDILVQALFELIILTKKISVNVEQGIILFLIKFN